MKHVLPSEVQGALGTLVDGGPIVLEDLSWGGVRRVVALPPLGAQHEGRMIDLPGRGRTYVTELGPREAPTLMMLHALACTALLTWYPVIEELSKHYRVVLPDLRWHGQGIRSVGSSLDDAAADVVAVADVLEIDRFVPVGYSMGSLIAQLLWRNHRERVSGLVVCATSSSFRRSSADRLAMRLSDVAVASTRRRAERLATLVPRALEPADETYRWALGQFRATGPLAMGQAVSAISKFNSTDWIGESDVPTAVVITGRDRVIRPGRQRWIARQIYGATSYEIPSGHSSCVMDAAAFRPALLAACASVAGRLA
ncbi:MAG: alpha/beta fold hydrolase [Mycobacteriaceae bacterium]